MRKINFSLYLQSKNSEGKKDSTFIFLRSNL
nr:MAG TPA: hypothetical protein [Caudoviricetes sp.]DAW88934.1 MAG TPA: hypothetical protein [Caudoviricetes sp.]